MRDLILSVRMTDDEVDELGHNLHGVAFFISYATDALLTLQQHVEDKGAMDDRTRTITRRLPDMARRSAVLQDRNRELLGRAVFVAQEMEGRMQ